ncbi:MAG: hypothetical protein KAG94_01420 [Clostridiales bacterium]|nr:hypothetical protein [Clostridiales bacterium]
MKKKLIVIISFILVFTLVFAACGKKDDTTAGSTTDRNGGWLDQITMKVITGDSAVTQIQAGEIDIYADSLASKEDLLAINNAGLDKSTQFGLFYELTFNPAGPTFDATGKLNPFSVMEIREAMNYLIDRDYINQEVYGGGSIPKYLPITAGLPDYAKFVEMAREIESTYAYDMAKAETIITAEMETLGATKVDGKWNYNGEVVELIFLIRNDSDGTRIPIGDYISDQLEAIGFTVDRQYKSSPECSPFWIAGDPNDGGWHLYTGAWSVTGMARDVGGNFQFYYSNASGMAFTPLWQAYDLDDELYEVCEALANNTFTTLEERADLFREAIFNTIKYSYRIWLIDGASYSFWDNDVITSYDLASGVDISAMTPYTIRFKDLEGGNLTWGSSGLFVDPPNPLGGSNWTFDHQWQNFTQDYATLGNPFTGLPMKQRIESAEITIETGLPVGKTYDWVALSFQDEIQVPSDAWFDWDVNSQTFITVGDAHPEGITARRKSKVTYPATLFDDVTWHDGTPLSVADFVMGMIMIFDPSTEGSAIYDSSLSANLDSFKSTFKGMKIVSESPLVIEYYSDTYYMDAEINIASFWPDYDYGQASWYQIAIANLAEEAGETAYTANKSTEMEIEWLSLIAGPSLEILAKYNTQAQAESYIPYEATLGNYLTAEQAATAYTNLAQFYTDHGHFYSGVGPYILDRVLPVEQTLTLINNPNFADPSDKWADFSAPKMAVVEIEGKSSIKSGKSATFDVLVTFKGSAYASEELDTVKYLLYDATGAVYEVGDAVFVKEGKYEVELDGDTTTALGTGACKLEIAVVAIPVSVPSFEILEFVTE